MIAPATHREIGPPQLGECPAQDTSTVLRTDSSRWWHSKTGRL